jgi:hypothetical protein
MDKDKKRARAFASSKKREEKRATLSGEELARPFILGEPYPADHPYAAGCQPVVPERVEAVAAGKTNALPAAVAWCRRYLEDVAACGGEAEFFGTWAVMGHDSDQGDECDCCKCRAAAGRP